MTTPEPPELEEVRILRVQPGDVIAIITPHQVTMHEAHLRRREMRLVCPDNECVVITAAELAVLRPEEVRDRGDG